MRRTHSGILCLFVTIIIATLIDCNRNTKVGDSGSDSIVTEDPNALSDAETEYLYGASPEPDWHFEVLVEEDAPADGEDASLYAGGWKYDGITIKTIDGYAPYNNHENYQWNLPLYYLVCGLSAEYSQSGDTYPTKAAWRAFQTEVLDPLRDGGVNWETIQNNKWRKEAGDIYYSLESKEILPLDRTAGWQSYYYEFGTENKRQHRIILKSLPENNPYNLPKGTLAIITLIWQ